MSDLHARTVELLVDLRRFVYDFHPTIAGEKMLERVDAILAEHDAAQPTYTPEQMAANFRAGMNTTHMEAQAGRQEAVRAATIFPSLLSSSLFLFPWLGL